MSTSGQQHQNAFNQSLLYWQNKLLQLDRRNGLLYFNTDSRSCVKFIEHDTDDVVSALNDNPEGIRIALCPTIARANPRQFIDIQSSSKELIATGCTDIELINRLRKLRARDREWEEEQGVNVLYLVLGFLHWIDNDATNVTSPLLLLSCDLNQENISSPFFLSREPDDIAINTTLQHRLGLEGLHIPDFQPEESVREYLSRCRHLISETRDYTISDEIVLSTFPYSKLSLWQDLDQIKREEYMHPLIRSLAGDDDVTSQQAPTNLTSEDLSGGALDDLFDPINQFYVLPSDFSQTAAVETVRNGSHTIIHGPPGTGKSQTIVNLISNLLADGKRILFVSEKAAAIEVVKRRLNQVGLGLFCLDLHTDGTKEQIYLQIAHSLVESRESTTAPFSFTQYRSVRNKLNAFIRSMHKVRKPIRLSLYQINERLLQLADFPDCPLLKVSKPYNPGNLTNERLQYIVRLACRLNHYGEFFTKEETCPWYAMQLKMLTEPFLKDQITTEVNTLGSVMEQIKEHGKDIALTLGISAPQSVLEFHQLFQSLCSLIELTELSPEQLCWFGKVKEVARLRRYLVLENRKQRILNRWKLNDATNIRQHRDDIVNCVKLMTHSRALLEKWFGIQKVQTLPDSCAQDHQTIVNYHRVSQQFNVLQSKLGDICNSILNDSTNSVSDTVFQLSLLDRNNSYGIAEIYKCLTSTVLVLSELETLTIGNFPPVQSQNTTSHLLQALICCQIKCRDLLHACEHFNAVFSGMLLKSTHEVTTLADQLAKLESIAPVPDAWWAHNEDVLRLVNAGARLAESVTASRNLVRNTFLSDEILRLVDDGMSMRIQRYGNLLNRFRSTFSKDKRVVQGYLRCWPVPSLLNTTETLESLISARHALERWAAIAPNLAAVLGEHYQDVDTDWTTISLRWELFAGLNLADGPLRNIAKERASCRSALVTAQTFMSAINSFADSFLHLNDQLSMSNIDMHLPNILKESTSIAKILLQLEALTSSLSDGNITSLKQLEQLANDLEELDLLEEEMASIQALQPNFNEAISQVQCLAELTTTCLQDNFSTATNIATNSTFDITTILDRVRHSEIDTASVEMNYAHFVSAIMRLSQLIAAPFADFNTVPFTVLDQWITTLTDLLPTLTPWIHYRRTIAQMERELSPEFVQQLRRTTIKVADASMILHKSLLSAVRMWLQESDKTSTYNRKEYEPLRKEFIRLDRLLLSDVSRNSVRSQLFKNYPAPYTLTSSVGEVAVFINEFKKRRGALPIRQLLTHIPNLITVLKPVFMMSPLAVSRYIALQDTPPFDVLIFDEASQIFPEDAIACIARANQTVVVGDPKQLPPTNFFRKATDSDDDDGEEQAIGFDQAGLESILDSMQNLLDKGVAESHLSVHYRSKDNSLIDFSNDSFYSRRLTVFPAPPNNQSKLGLRDNYVPNGQFHSGASRTNPIEADVAVDILFQHLAEYGDSETVGIVAFSRAQADLIDQKLIERRMANQQWEQLFSEDRPEPVIVKNLENVQGDERDHIILSVAYGPSPTTGKVANHFGPLNRLGGERRLNVAVTRARKKMTVVRSINPEHITSQMPGAKALRSFLEYVHDPLSRNIVKQADIANQPLISTIAKNLSPTDVLQLNYGTSSFSIEAAIVQSIDHPPIALRTDGLKHFAYKSARDREWLIDDVLDALGWSNRHVYIEDIIHNLQAEMDELKSSSHFHQLNLPIERTFSPILTRQQALEALDDLCSHDIQIFEPYRKTTQSLFPNWSVATVPSYQSATKLVVITEGPITVALVIERLRELFGFQRVGPRMREEILSSLSEMLSRNILHSSDSIKRTKTLSLETFLWHGQLSNILPRVSSRNHKDIHSEEVHSGLKMVAKYLYSIAPDELIRETARQFGISRLTSEAHSYFTNCLTTLLKKEKLRKNEGRVYWNPMQ